MIWIIAFIFLHQNAAGQTTGPTGALFKYGPEVGDQELHNDNNLPLYMGYNVNFYGRKYNTSYVTKNGYVAFAQDAKYEHFIFKDGAKDPDLDFPFVAPFYFDGREITKDSQGKIYYRLVFTNTSQDFLTQLRYYMLNATTGVEKFVPDVAVVVTWENVTDKFSVEDGLCQGTNADPCKSSTFQLVLVACPMNTFVIFNYRKIDIPKKTYYQAGINGGHGVGWTSVCPKCDIYNLPNEKGSDVTGRFIFRVSGDTIERGGCSETGAFLQVSPDIAGMFGGELLDISGPCVGSDPSVVCKFGADSTTAVTSQGFRYNSMRVKCPVPRLTERGSVPLAVSLDGGNSYTAQGQIYIVMESQVNKSLVLGEGWHQVDPSTLDMTWNPATLSSDPSAKVDIQLIGYREGDIEVEWKVLTTLATGVDNTGSYSFDAVDVQCHPADCELYEVAVVEVALQKDFHQLANSRLAMKAGALLGWYVNNHMTSNRGDNWPPQLCTEWYDKDKTDKTWLNTLLHCPCNVDQALADFGRWQPDHGCSMFSTSTTNCYYHEGAKHCVRSFKPTSSDAGNQCCYDESGLLLYAADTYQGSTPDRSHDWGSAPYKGPGKVPSLSHWIRDVVSFYYCCLWTEYSSCNYYMDLRPTRDCAGYQPSQAAFAYGDPHIMTFDGQLYNFGGKGTYYLLKTEQFELQGLFEIGPQTHVNNHFFNATVLTSVAMMGMGDTPVEIHLAPMGLNSGRKLDVFVNKKMRIFDNPAVFKQDFEGVSVVNVVPDPTKNLHDNFTVIFTSSTSSGIGVQVAASNNLLNVIVNLPPSFKNKTSGLLGTWNGVISDDYTTIRGVVVPIDSPKEDVYQRFAKTWSVPEIDFQKVFKNTEKADETFVPVYNLPQIPQGSGFSQADLDFTCEDDAQCRFDYVVTGNRDIADASKKAGSWFTELKSFQKAVESCGLLNVPYAEKDNKNYSFGNTVILTGCRNGGSLSGDTTYTCSRTSDFGTVQWSPPVSAGCSDTVEGANVGMIVGIVVAVVAAIIIIIIIAVVSYRRHRNGERKSSKKGEPEKEEGQKDPMMSELQKKQDEDPENNV